MTDAKFDDFNGNNKVIKADLSYTVDVYSVGNKCHIKGDMQFEESLKMIVQAFVSNGCEWYKNQTIDGKWQKIKVEDPHQGKIDN